MNAVNCATVLDVLTVEEFKLALPEKIRRTVNQELIDQINLTLAEPELYEQFRENLVSYGRVIAEGRFKASEYVNAVKFVTHKLGGATGLEAYSRTFPSKIIRFANQGVVAKDIASYVTAYGKSKLVGLIMEQTLVPCWILNQDLYQRALNTQAELMINANSEKVRTDAANSLLTHLKMPEKTKVELDITMKEDSSINALRQATLELVAQQRLSLQAGQVTASEVARSSLVMVVDVVDAEII